MKKVLLTGGSGFIGQNVKEYFKSSEQFDIIAPSSTELNCINEESVVTFLKNNDIDIVLNFAVYGDGIDRKKDGSKILEYNLRMYYNFANNSHLYKKMFYAGSGAEYDKRFPICSVKEDEIGKTIPIDPYGLMKYIVGKDIEQSSNIYNLRLFGIFGKYEYWPIKFISNICCKSLMGLPLSIRQNVYFDYLWINDFLNILECMMNSEKIIYHTYNIVSGCKVDLLTLCRIVNKCAEKEKDIIVCREGLANEYTASNERLLRDFANIKITPIEKAVSELYTWYETHLSDIDLMKLLY